ncbi:glycoside hydrolase family 10 protein [Pararhodonellum marinum]|uniref:hypothetical protein n=1 Tax=Pararhodonellum marinum TaxID=2755358 RepID=UPI0018906F18|nr:hypothetical protein [Pararhodonellum marinum]
MKFTWICLFVLFCVLPTYAQTNEALPFIKGIYGNPGALLDRGHSFKSLGVNAIFPRSISLNDQLFQTAQSEGVKVYVEFPTLNGKEYLEKYPEAWPINELGEKAEPADWFMGICPTDPEFKAYRKDQLRTLLGRYPVDGIWLDYLHWHGQFETPEPILPETCFCDRCVHSFEKSSQVKLPKGNSRLKSQWILSKYNKEWRQWRSQVLTDWVKELKQVVKTTKPDALLGIFYCAWYPDEFGGALTKNLGIDLKALSEEVDVFSPMLFHLMMGREITWVDEYTKWLGPYIQNESGTGPRIWPIVQAHDQPGMVTAEAFRQVLMRGSQKPATGIMMFSEEALITTPHKLEIMQSWYQRD